MGKTVFILGTGASACAGAPLMNNFLDREAHVHAHNRSTLFAQDFQVVFRVHAALMKGSHSKSSIDLNNIESLFSTVEMSRVIDHLPGQFDSKTRRAASAIEALKRVFARTIEMEMGWRSLDGEHLIPAAAHTLLVGMIKEASKLDHSLHRERFSVLTFNYDVSIDWALYSAKTPFTYALDESESEGELPLLRLHGSLNCFQQDDRSSIHSISEADLRCGTCRRVSGKPP